MRRFAIGLAIVVASVLVLVAGVALAVWVLLSASGVS